MFDAIAGRYDFLNHLLSAGLDKRWRRQAVDALQLTGRETVLDLCTGTADLALAAMSGQHRAKRVVGVDFSAAMLQIGMTSTKGRSAGRAAPPSISFAATRRAFRCAMPQWMPRRLASAFATSNSPAWRAAKSRECFVPAAHS